MAAGVEEALHVHEGADLSERATADDSRDEVLRQLSEDGSHLSVAAAASAPEQLNGSIAVGRIMTTVYTPRSLHRHRPLLPLLYANGLPHSGGGVRCSGSAQQHATTHGFFLGYLSSLRQAGRQAGSTHMYCCRRPLLLLPHVTSLSYRPTCLQQCAPACCLTHPLAEHSLGRVLDDRSQGTVVVQQKHQLPVLKNRLPRIR